MTNKEINKKIQEAIQGPGVVAVSCRQPIKKKTLWRELKVGG